MNTRDPRSSFHHDVGGPPARKADIAALHERGNAVGHVLLIDGFAPIDDSARPAF